MRRLSPASLSPLDGARPFSISSIQSTHGAIDSASSVARRKLRSDSPMNLS